MRTDLAAFSNELHSELLLILRYWETKVIDPATEGFYGSVDVDDHPVPGAPQGLVMYSRILWAFSSAYELLKEEHLLRTADRAYQYMTRHFVDLEFGGLYWSLDAEGKPLADRKQIYGHAFAMYGLSAYARARPDVPAVPDLARELFTLIETRSRDEVRGGYIEAFDREWGPLQDLRLSDKDDNERKTMNTHLHIVEAYAELYRVWPDSLLRERIIELLHLFDQHIIDHHTGHLLLFFTDEWVSRSALQSFGHDIEAGWLLLHCAEVIVDADLMKRFAALAPQITDAAAEGLDGDGGLWYELEPGEHGLVKEKHSWPQAEAMIGFFNAWKLTGSESYLDKALATWRFTRQWLIDPLHGEWYWGVNEDYSLMKKDKAGFWKCPYHNTRACLEIIRRTGRLNNETLK